MPTTELNETDTSNFSGISEAFGGLAEALIDETDADDSLEADLADTGEDVAEPVEEVAAEVVAEEVVEEVVDPLESLLADAKALDYTVDGKAKDYDGIKMTADGRGIISKESIPDVQYRLQRGEYLESQNTHLYGQVKQYEAIGGMQKVESLSVENARLSEAVKLLAETIENPDKLVALALATQSGDTAQFQLLTRELKIAAQEAAIRAKSEFTQHITTAASAASNTQDETTQTANTIAASITQWSPRYPNLSPDDLASANRLLTQFGAAVVWKASPEDARQAGVKPGEYVIDHRKVDAFLKDLSDRKVGQQKTVTAVSAAAKENALRLGGPKSAPKKPAPKATKPKAEEPEGETWSQQKSRLQRGEFSSSDE